MDAREIIKEVERQLGPDHSVVILAQKEAKELLSLALDGLEFRELPNFIKAEARQHKLKIELKD